MIDVFLILPFELTGTGLSCVIFFMNSPGRESVSDGANRKWKTVDVAGQTPHQSVGGNSRQPLSADIGQIRYPIPSIGFDSEYPILNQIQ